MGDISAEPSMEEILSSIKRIIAEEGDPSQSRPRRPQRPSPTLRNAAGDDADMEDGRVGGNDEPILELSDPMPSPDHPRARPTVATPAPAEPILSQETAAASRGALETLSKLLVKPEPASDGTLEGLVREMLRPMLRDWLDAHLPEMVETMVAHEIARITGQPR